MVIERTAQFGINNFLALQNDCTDNWNFHNSFFFAGTGREQILSPFKINNIKVATTIGYGTITPTTREGKIFCIVLG